MFDLKAIVRPNIWSLKPYRCARDDYSEGILLDANENAYGPCSALILNGQRDYRSDSALERYPDPHQLYIKRELATLRGVEQDNFFLGVGSDESIDLAIRVFCRPGMDKILITPPTYGMYSVSAQVNDVSVIKIPLLTEQFAFQLNVDEMLKTLQDEPLIKIVFICSPGNPTGVLIQPNDIKRLLESSYAGIVLVDEAYIDFCDESSSIASWVTTYPNLIVTQTFSKSFGVAGIRLGVSISSKKIAALFNNTKAPYNISTPTSLIGRDCVSPAGLARMRSNVALLESQKTWLRAQLTLPGIGLIGPSNANFLLVQIVDDQGKPDSVKAHLIYKSLAESHGVVVRYRGNEIGCDGCLRITIGTADENLVLMKKLALLLT